MSGSRYISSGELTEASLPLGYDCDMTDIHGFTLPFLKRNVYFPRKRRYKVYKNSQKLTESRISDKIPHALTGGQTKSLLKRNLVKKQKKLLKCCGMSHTKVLKQNSNRNRYWVHCLEKKRNDSVNTTTATFSYAAFDCPFCRSFNGDDFESLWIHCSIIHGDRYTFRPVQTVDSELHLLSINEQNLLSHEEVDSMRQKTQVLFVRNMPNESIVKVFPLFHDIFHKLASLPIRQYYRNVTFNSIGLTEWLCNMKEDEYDPSWRRIQDTSALYEMADIRTSSKHFMSIWNEYIRNNSIISEMQLSSCLISFMQTNSTLIFENKLEEELMVHLTNMWVEGQIGRNSLLESMKIYNKLVNTLLYQECLNPGIHIN